MLKVLYSILAIEGLIFCFLVGILLLWTPSNSALMWCIYLEHAKLPLQPHICYADKSDAEETADVFRALVKGQKSDARNLEVSVDQARVWRGK